MKDKGFAEESCKTQRAREKLKKQMDMWKKSVTPEALAEKKQEMHLWIARRASHRVTLRDKEISLFDENQNAAGLSRKVALFAQRIGSGSCEESTQDL